MSFRKFVKRLGKKAGAVVKKVGGYAMTPAKTVISGFKKGGDGEGGTRSEAATKLLKKDVSQQAGSGQINYTTEEETPV